MADAELLHEQLCPGISPLHDELVHSLNTGIDHYSQRNGLFRRQDLAEAKLNIALGRVTDCRGPEVRQQDDETVLYCPGQDRTWTRDEIVAAQADRKHTSLFFALKMLDEAAA